MKINRKIGILLIIFLLLAVVIFFIMNRNNNSNSSEVAVEKKIFDCDSINYSRLSFFNATNDRISLNIPESWEGNYRLKEEGNNAIFYYLSKDGSASKMFGISKKIDSNDSEKIICEKEDSKFILDIYDLELGQNYNKTIDNLDCVIRSIKCY